MSIVFSPEKICLVDDLKDILDNWKETEPVGTTVSRQVNSVTHIDRSNIWPLIQAQIKF